ncbi:MAG: TetR/AcrR family transcriptional regulator [Verrucomicrobiota bacterium]
MSEKREQIIQVATDMIRSGGYNAFSFREIADAIGIKSSSVHHYFRRKEDLAAAVAERYTDGFFSDLGKSSFAEGDVGAAIDLYASVFIEAFVTSGKACLCGVLSHESPAIPAPVLERVDSFVERNIEWLVAAFYAGAESVNGNHSRRLALLVYTALSGSMAVATLKKSVEPMELVRDQLVQQLSSA